MCDDHFELLINEFLKNYQDRGLLKYQGFYLSDHTSALHEDSSLRHNFVEARSQMDEYEISNTIEQALLHTLPVTVQINSRDKNEGFSKDISGMINGIETNKLYVNRTAISIDLIRNIQLIHKKKWFDVDV